MVEAFAKANQAALIDIAFRRLCSGVTGPYDEGYEALRVIATQESFAGLSSG